MRSWQAPRARGFEHPSLPWLPMRVAPARPARHNRAGVFLVRKWITSGDNLLITRAYVSGRRRETLGQGKWITRPRTMLRLCPVVERRDQARWARIVTPWRIWRRKRKRRRVVSTAFCVNRGAVVFCNGPKSSGGTSPQRPRRQPRFVSVPLQAGEACPLGRAVPTRRHR